MARPKLVTRTPRFGWSSTPSTPASLRQWGHGREPPLLLPVHALEDTGVNEIPVALAEELRRGLGWTVLTSIVQVNVVGHTGASGHARLARQALFDGDLQPDKDYVLVDDFVGQCGTLANLRGHVLAGGGRVVGAITLTGKLSSAKLMLSSATLADRRRKHGPELERWWEDRFGHAFDCLTESEGRYLARAEDAQRVRDQVVEAERRRDRSAD